MKTAPTQIPLYVRLGALLRYPVACPRSAAHEAAQEMDRDCPKGAGSLRQFLDATADWEVSRFQEYYTVAFDVTPKAVPYLSVYLFGAESPKRADMMIGLNTVYERAGVDIEGELPDHIAVIFQHAGAFTAEEWDEMLRCCLGGPLNAMAQGLQQTSNPYLHVLRAVQHLLDAHKPREIHHV